MKRLNALLISNGIEGLAQQFQANDRITYTLAEIGPGFDPDLSGYDLVIAPNGTDHVALFRIREKIRQFLDGGGALFCFDGWFTDWIPGNRWVMDNSKKTIDVRYILQDDPDGLAQHFSIADLNFSHGISGWWSCGFIEPAPGAQVLIADTWGRALAVIDRVSTNGLIVLTASGPLGDFSYATTDDDGSTQAMADLYQALLSLVSPTKILSK
jgi:hypothetical protein